MDITKDYISKSAFGIAVFAIIIFIISFVFYDTNISQANDEVTKYNEWKVNGRLIDLDEAPIQYDTSKPTIYTNTITKDMAGKVIEFETSHQRVYVYYGDKLFYSLENGKFFNHTAGTAYNVVDIPVDAVGKEIKIEIYNCYSGYKNTEKLTFVYSSMTSLYRYFMHKEFLDAIVNIMLLISGVVVLLGSFILVRYVKSTIDIVYLSLFELFMAIWSLSVSGTFNIMVGYPSAMNSVGYYSLFLAPLFCLLYVRNNTYGKNISKRFISIVLGIHCAYIILTTILQIFNIADFNRTLIIYHVILALEVILFGIFALRSIRMEAQEGRRRTSADKVLIIPLLGVGLDLISWNVTYTYNTFLTRLGIFIYTSSIIYKFAKKLFDEVAENISKDELKQIAYTDQLTGIPNRNAFISKINTLDLEKAVIVAFDLNNLKYYNDHFGHDRGDVLLKTMAQKLQDVFDDNAYRIGGDEFEVVLDECTKDDLWALLEKFEEEEKTFNSEKHDIYLQAAYGVGYYQGSDSINDILKMADENMYMHKKFLKSKGSGIYR